MVGFSSWVASALALTGALASPLLEIRQGSSTPVTGATQGGNAPRRDINTIFGNAIDRNMYLLAWEAFQNDNQQQQDSFYGIGGIHGMPIKPWDGVQGGQGANQQTGYCPHDSNMFIPWHRPYLALIEQRLQDHAIQLANQFTQNQQQYQQAAQQLRLAYWDWASRSSPVLPAAFTQPQVQVTRPNGQQATISNPLYQYNFHPVSASDFGNFQPYSYWPATKRAPQGTAQNAPSNEQAVQNAVTNSNAPFRQRIYNLFTNKGKYNLITNHGSGSQGDTFEAMHDSIHGSFGANSHMLLLSFSGFDPIFYHHHCNVDRQVAIWQKLHPKTYVQPAQQSGATYVYLQGATLDASSPLKPFHRNAQGDFWTSASVRDTTALHYTYPELQDNPSKQTLKGRVNQLYGNGAAGVAQSQSKKLMARQELDPQAVVQQYIVLVAAPINGLNGPYTTSVFIGNFDATTPVTTWNSNPNFAGTHTVMGSMGGATNLVYGEIILTELLIAKHQSGELTDLDEDSVVDYVTKNMNYAISQNGQAVPADKMPAVKVSLISNKLKPKASATDFPTTVQSGIEHANLTVSGVASSVSSLAASLPSLLGSI